MARLTNKQKAFVREYLVDFNGVRAAMRAGYTGSYNTVGRIAYKLLNMPKIKKAIKKHLDERAMTADEVLMRLADQARGVYGEFIDADGNVDLQGLKDAGLMHLIKSIRDTKYGKSIHFYDAQSALQLLGRHHALFTDKVMHTWQDEVIELLQQGTVTPKDVREELGDELARELFESVGISTATD